MHVGLGKTGSTSIQKYLEMFTKPDSHFNRENVYYPTSPEDCLFSEYIWRKNFPIKDLKSLKDIAGKINALNQKFFIISGEILTHSEDIAKARILDFFLEIFEHIQIIAYVRDPFKWNAASAGQLIHDRVTLSNLEKWPYLATQFGFLKIYSDFAKVNHNVIINVRKFESAITDNGGIAGDFRAQLVKMTGYDFPLAVDINIHANRSKSLFELIILGKLNEFVIQSKNDNEYIDLIKIYDGFCNERQTLLSQSGMFYQYYAVDKTKRSIEYDRMMILESFSLQYDVAAANDIDVGFIESFRDNISKGQSISTVIKAAEKILKNGVI
jgi:hypothetical protein